MEPDDYAQWICKPKEWGGIPELKILSEHYGAIICVLDIGNDEIIEFKGSSTKQLIFLVFDGSHYNLGAQLKDADQQKKVFTVDELDDVSKEILALGKLLKENGQYIDPNLFALKCMDCGQPLAGQIEAVEHAK